MKAALVIMAAGIGSRYGGVKQIDAVGPAGETVMEYSIHDAIRAGFSKIVFIIKRDIHDQLSQMCEYLESTVARDGDKVELRFAFQDNSGLPDFFEMPEGRTKPLGTAHALLCAREVTSEPFAIINADDYYGIEAFSKMYTELAALQESGEGTMVGYRLKNTVSRHGSVTRGVCTAESGLLRSVMETYKIQVFPDGTIRDTDNTPDGELLNQEALVSMNFWGFTPWIFERAEEYFEDFLRALPADGLTQECLLPMLVDKLMNEGTLTVSVLDTESEWFGMTYKEDRDIVARELKKLHSAGVYPPTLRP